MEKATEAREKNEQATEMEQIQLAYINLLTENNLKSITAEQLQNELVNNYEVIDIGEKRFHLFNSNSQREYIIDENGKVSLITQPNFKSFIVPTNNGSMDLYVLFLYNTTYLKNTKLNVEMERKTNNARSTVINANFNGFLDILNINGNRYNLSQNQTISAKKLGVYKIYSYAVTGMPTSLLNSFRLYVTAKEESNFSDRIFEKTITINSLDELENINSYFD